MANEKKVTELEQAAKAATEKAIQTTEKGNLIVERETFKAKDKREMYGYFVRGKARGREIKVDFVAKDQGGYETLELIFDINPTAELLIRQEELVTDGVKTAYTVYEVQNVDEDGIVYKYEVKPARKSDAAYLNVILQILEKQKAKEKAEKTDETKASA